MAAVQAMSTVAPAQTRIVRGAATAWSPPSNGLMHTRPWRSSPLAGPAFSSLPPAIPESSEEHEHELNRVRELPQTRSPSSSSIASQTGSLSASGYGSRNASGSALALALADVEDSASSTSLHAHGTSSSQGHASSQTHSNRPVSLSKSKSRGNRTSLTKDDFPLPKDANDVFIALPPRARTVSHNPSSLESLHVHPIQSSPTIPPAYSRTSRKALEPESDTKVLSKSRDPTSDWRASSPFGPAQTPKFSRLAMASPKVVMPLSAKEYRKQKARESLGRGGERELPTTSNHVAFVDNVPSVSQSPTSVPVVKVLPPPGEDIDQPPLSPGDHPGDHSPDRRSQPQQPVNHLPCKPLSQTTMSPRPSSPKQKRPRSRPNTPPRSSPLAAHPPISPKSSTGTFFSFASTSEDNVPSQGTDTFSSTALPTGDTNVVPPARPRPHLRRRKSYPNRLSNGARLSLLGAMNRLSQDSTTLHRLSGHSQTDVANRLSAASQASGHTLFFDVADSEGEKGRVASGRENGHADGGSQRRSVLHTQSLEDLPTALDRTGIEVVHPDGDGDPDAASDDGRKGKRNVRMVRISETVEVSPSPAPRQRKLTKSRPMPARGPATVLGTAPASRAVKEVKPQTQTQSRTQERRGSLLPWKSKSSVVGANSGAIAGGRTASTPPKDPIYPSNATPAPVTPRSSSPTVNGSAPSESRLKFNTISSAKKVSSGAPVSVPATTPSPDSHSVPSASPRKSRRYTFSFLSPSTFHRPKHEKSGTAPSTIDLSLDQNTKGKKNYAKGIESGTDSTSTSILTTTQGSQSTLVLASPVLRDLTTLGPSGELSGSGRGTRSSVPMLRRLNAEEMESTDVPLRGEWNGKDGPTQSLISNGSTSTSSSIHHSPSIARGLEGGEPFVSRPSGLKESFTDPSEGFSEAGSGGDRMCMHRRHEQSPLTCAYTGDTSKEGDRYLRPSAGTHLGSRPGTSDSTLTTATETSGSYVSFSTVPASTSLSSSSLRSESPPPVAGDKQDQVMSALEGEHGDEPIQTCTMCGHRSASPTRSLSPSWMYRPDVEEMHPMFTIPLVTTPRSTFATHPHLSTNAPLDALVAKHMSGRKSKRHTSVPMPAVATAAVNAPRDQNHVHFSGNGGPVTTPKSKSRTLEMATKDKMVITMTTMTPPPPVPASAPHKVGKRRRPQTAPAGTGDAGSKFIEDTMAMYAHEGNGNAHFHAEGDRSTRPKAVSRDSRFKTVLKGLLRWTS